MSFRKHLEEVAGWLREIEPIVLTTMLLTVALIWGFAKLASEVQEGETLAFDKAVLRALRRSSDPSTPIGPHWVQEFGRDCSAFGSTPTLALVTLVVVGYLAMIHKRRLSLFLFLATGAGFVLSAGLKVLFDRPRPEVVPQLSFVYTTSFPSGHSMLSAIVYLTLASLLAAATARLSVRCYFIAVAVAVSTAVGLSRVYLGVHYPTDVAAGWMAGCAWALLSWLVARWMQSQGILESKET